MSPSGPIGALLLAAAWQRAFASERGHVGCGTAILEPWTSPPAQRRIALPLKATHPVRVQQNAARLRNGPPGGNPMSNSRHRKNAGDPLALQPVAGNGLIDRRALLGRGMVFAGAAAAGTGTSL